MSKDKDKDKDRKVVKSPSRGFQPGEQVWLRSPTVAGQYLSAIVIGKKAPALLGGAVDLPVGDDGLWIAVTMASDAVVTWSRVSEILLTREKPGEPAP